VTPGFEPEMTESKSVVLPLHHVTICSQGRTRTGFRQPFLMDSGTVPHYAHLTMLQLLYLISELPTVSTND
jgi:hypothetical protein